MLRTDERNEISIGRNTGSLSKRIPKDSNIEVFHIPKTTWIVISVLVTLVCDPLARFVAEYRELPTHAAQCKNLDVGYLESRPRSAVRLLSQDSQGINGRNGIDSLLARVSYNLQLRPGVILDSVSFRELGLSSIYQLANSADHLFGILNLVIGICPSTWLRVVSPSTWLRVVSPSTWLRVVNPSTLLRTVSLSTGLSKHLKFDFWCLEMS